MPLLVLVFAFASLQKCFEVDAVGNQPRLRCYVCGLYSDLLIKSVNSQGEICSAATHFVRKHVYSSSVMGYGQSYLCLVARQSAIVLRIEGDRGVWIRQLSHFVGAN